MRNAPSFTLWSWLALVLVLGSAAGSRSWYLMSCAEQGWSDAVLMVQGDDPRPNFPAGTEYRSRERPTELDNLVSNLVEHHEFKCLTPLSEKEELTAHRAPGYPSLLAVLTYLQKDSADWSMRWLQAALGSLTALLYFLFARRAFHSTLIGLVAGLLTAFYPFWIINTAELNDGVLTSFLLAFSLMFGTRSSQNGGAFSGLLFGLGLAALCLVRASMLPFAFVAMLWFLWRCQQFSLGWFAAILTLVGFLNGLAPWMVRDYQQFGRPVPLATSTYLHLWIGNHQGADGSDLDEAGLRSTLPGEKLNELLNEPNQMKRYDRLAPEVWHEVREHPTQTLTRRLTTAFVFLFGERGVKQQQFAQERTAGPEVADMPDELRLRADNLLTATLLGLFLLALLGWRWSFGWRLYGRLGAIAAVWIPMPYVLSHAETLSGPRLPYDGILLCYAAFALVSFIPGMVRDPEPLVAARPVKGK